MATKECPYCHKEIADEAILCKYCHNLLIGGNQDIESAVIASRERARQKNAVNASNTVDRALGAKRPAARDNDEDLTREFSTVDAADYQEKTRAFTVPKQAAPQPKRPEPQPVRQPGPQPSSNYYDDDEYYDDDQYYDDDDQYYDDDGYYDDTYEDDGYEDDGRYAKGARSSRASNGRDYYAGGGDYYEDEYDDEDESANKKKKIFIITALITVSVIAVVALAIFVGYKLVGFAKGGDSSSLAAGSKTSSITTATKITESTTTSKTEATTTTKSSTEEQTTTTTEQTTTETTTDTQWSPTETQTETQTQTQTETQTQTQSETQSQTQQSQTQQGGTDQAQVLANVATALANQNNSGIKSYEYRSEDDGAVYLYVFTNDNHAYSVAYFKSSGNSKIVQAW